MKKVFLAILCALCIVVPCGCVRGSYKTIRSNVNNTSSEMSMTYDYFEGFKERTVSLSKGDVITAKISALSGSLDIAIIRKGNPNEEIFSERYVPTSEFTVDIEESGTYIIRITARYAVGGYSFIWD